MSQQHETRIAWVDAAKGIAIIGVIIGHTEAVPAIIKDVPLSFHMSLFFFLSGYTFRSRGLVTTAKKSARQLVAPWFVLCIYRLIDRIWNADITYDFTNSMYVICKALLFNASYSDIPSLLAVGIGWFLLSLFFARCFVEVLLPVIEEKCIQFKFLISLVLIYIGMAIGKVCGPFVIFNFTSVLIGTGFMIAGNTFRKHHIIEGINCIKMWFIVLLVVWVICMRNSHFDIGSNTFIGNLWALGPIAAFSGTCLSCMVCISLERSQSRLLRPLEWTGNHSMIVYAIHSMEIPLPWAAMSRTFGWALTLALRVVLDCAMSWIFVFYRKH